MKKLSPWRFIFAIFLSSCSLFHTQTRGDSEVAQGSQQSEQNRGQNQDSANSGLTPADPSMAAHNSASSPAPGTPHPPSALEAAGMAATSDAHKSADANSGVSAEQSLRWLKNGNLRFIKSHRRSDGLSSADRVRLSTGQKPHAIILSCADSRVPPEYVFDQALGEIFVVRVAGEALDSSVIASLEYAVAHLGSKLLVVMGHDSCGAIKAAVAAREGKMPESAWIKNLVSDIIPRLPASTQRSIASEPLGAGAESSIANAKGVVVDLVKRSSLIRQAIVSDQLKIVSAIYYLKSGQVEFFN